MVLGIPYVKSEHWEKFFGAIADKIKTEINPKTVLDVGCAKGFLVEKFGGSVEVESDPISSVRETGLYSFPLTSTRCNRQWRLFPTDNLCLYSKTGKTTQYAARFQCV